ncbi:MAG: adenylate/guanylate cyclase domain-containing protein, partial [Myxococcaceae bacterium]
ADSRFAGRESVLLDHAAQVLCGPIGEKPPFSGVLYLNKSSREDDALESYLELCTAVGHLVGSAVEKFDIRHRAPDEGRLRTSLDRNLPPEIVDRRLTEIAQHGPSRVVHLQEQVVSLLSVELVGAFKLPVAKLGQYLTMFQQRVRGVVFSFEGGIVEITGDSALAVFGAPYGKENDALRAVRAALSIRSDWTKQQTEFPPLRVGVHTGKVVAGTIGTPLWAEFTVVGETASLASKVRGFAKPSQVLMTGKTLGAVGARFEVTALGERKLEDGGKVALFEVLEEDLGQSTASGTLRNSD